MCPEIPPRLMALRSEFEHGLRPLAVIWAIIGAQTFHMGR